MTQFGIVWLRESSRNHCDSSSKYFFQLYVIFGQKNEMILSCVYACLPYKTVETYIEMISTICTIVKPFGNLISLLYRPVAALADFEQAFMLAFRHLFPNIEIKSCYFLFKHAHQRWLNRNGCKIIYRSNNDFGIWANMFGSSSFGQN